MSAGKPSLLEKLALHRPELRAWAMYDWANSAMVTIVITAVFPVFYTKVTAAGLHEDTATTYFGAATTAALVVVALTSPILGALADFRALKKRLLGTFAGIGIAAVASMVFLSEGDWLAALVLFALANIGAAGSFVFYDALLPHVARTEEMNRLSTSAYALGYVGGGLVLAALAWGIANPERLGLETGELVTRYGFLAVALWWLVFSVPLFLRIPEPPIALEPDETLRSRPVRTAFVRLGETFRELRGYKHALLMLVAFLLYNDGIVTIFRMAAIYAEMLDIPRDDVILAVILVQFAGVPFAFLFGRLAGSFGAKRCVLAALVVYIGIAALAYGITEVWHFYALAIGIATVQGGAQALSRSLFASMIPRHKSGEFFGLFAVGEKFAGIFGPLLFTATIGLTGSERSAILSVVLFFVVGFALLLRVDVEAGERAARAADAETRRVR